MELTEYQTRCKSTAVYSEQNYHGERIAYLALALCGEAGELANVVKKVVRAKGMLAATLEFSDSDSESEARLKLRDELGDVLWYLASLAREAGFTLDEIAYQNLDKLAKRYANAPAH